MIITVVSFKGGVGKSTTAAHIAARLQQRDGRTVLLDGDDNRSLTKWSQRGTFPVPVVDERQAATVARSYGHLVIDTPARPSAEDLRYLADGCDLLIVPTTPDRIALDAMIDTVQALRSINAQHYRILLTKVPPRPNRDGELARQALADHGLPVLQQMISYLVAFQRAVDDGVLVSEVNDPRAQRGWNEYVRAVDEAIG